MDLPLLDKQGNVRQENIIQYREFSGGPVVRTSHFHFRGLSSIPGPASRAVQPKKKDVYTHTHTHTHTHI